MRDGPIAFTKTEYSCGLCRYHKSHMQRSGRDPVYHHYCTHPDAEPKTCLVGIAALNSLEPDGRFIGRSELTPDWCPILLHGA